MFVSSVATKSSVPTLSSPLGVSKSEGYNGSYTLIPNPHSRRYSGNTKPPQYTKGYLAIPSPDSPRVTKPQPKQAPPPTPPKSPKPFVRTPSPRAEEAAARAAVIAHEGELTWVRSGGLLRTPAGAIDHTRTAQVRAEIAQLDAAAHARALKAAYEERWRRVLHAKDRAPGEAAWGWADVPWPTREETDAWIAHEEDQKRRTLNSRGSSWASPKRIIPNKPLVAPAAGQPPAPVSVEPSQLEGLTPTAMRAFLLPEASTRDSQNTSRPTKPLHYLRREMLHWHPDKFDTAVLSHIRPEERDLVREGAGVVWRWLSAEAGKGRRADGTTTSASDST